MDELNMPVINEMCGINITVELTNASEYGSDYWRFTCHKPKGHKGVCTDVMANARLVNSKEPHKVPFDMFRQKFSIRKPVKKKEK